MAENPNQIVGAHASGEGEVKLDRFPPEDEDMNIRTWKASIDARAACAHVDDEKYTKLSARQQRGRGAWARVASLEIICREMLQAPEKAEPN